MWSKGNALRLMLLFTLVLLLAAAGLGQETLATAVDDELRMSPLNPAFIAYMERLEEDDVGALSREGYTLGYMPPPSELPHLWEPTAVQTVSILSLPVSYDLRNEGRATGVRDQNPYSSCWAFATYGSMESYLRPAADYNFSENNLMLLHGFDWAPNQGGHHWISAAYLARWGGPVLEVDDPYLSDASFGLPPVKHVQQIKFIPNQSALIKQAVMNSGALYATVYYHDDPYGVGSSTLPNLPVLGNYYNTDTFAYFYNGGADPNHAVAIVGWDDNYPRSNFSIEPQGDGAWIIRNSWGEDWGEGGYFYLSYDDTHAGNNATAFHNAEPTTNYGRVYQYDPLGFINDFGTGSNTTMHGANIFQVTHAEHLSAVSTYALSQNTSYELRIYTGVSSGQPTSGQLRLTQAGSFATGGYYTIPLNNEVPLTAGERFSVVIRYTTPDTNLPLPVELALAGYSSQATASPGQSFYSFNGSSWQDITTVDPTANICIKAFTAGDTLDPDPDPDPDVPAETVTAEPNAEGRVTFEFPQSQVLITVESEEGGTIKVTRNDTETKSPPAKMNAADIYLTIDPCEALQGKPAKITVAYTLPLPEGVEESTLKLYRWTAAAWELLPNQSVDKNSKSITAQVVGFGTFGLFGAAEEDFILGDVNGDGKINVVDVTLIMQHSLGINTLNEVQKGAADVNSDGKIDVLDVVLVMQYSLNLIDEFPDLDA